MPLSTRSQRSYCGGRGKSIFRGWINALMAVLIPCAAACQETDSSAVIIRGRIYLPDLTPARRAIVSVHFKDSLQQLGFAIANPIGSYELVYFGKPDGNLLVSARFPGYAEVHSPVALNSWTEGVMSLDFHLTKEVLELENVVVHSRVPVSQRGDTTEYSAGGYQTLEGRKLGDLLKNMDGFSISPNGKIVYQGKEVSSVLIEGEDLTGDRYSLLTRNLSARLVEKVQVISNHQDNRLLNGVEGSEAVVLNLVVTDKARKAISGETEIGAGMPSRWYADLSATKIAGAFKGLLIGNVNNVARNPFDNLSGGDEASIAKDVESIPDDVYLKVTPLLPPFNESNYTDESGNLGGAIATSLKTGTFSSVRIFAAVHRMRLKRSEKSTNSYLLPSGGNWELIGERKSNNEPLQGVARVEWSRDSHKRSVQHLSFETQTQRGSNRFSEVTSGAVEEIRMEQGGFGRRSATLSFQETLSSNLRKVWVFKFMAQVVSNNQDLEDRTTRLYEYFGLTNGFNLFQQTMTIKQLQLRSQLRQTRKIGKQQMQYGIGFGANSRSIADSLRGVSAGEVRILNGASYRTSMGNLECFFQDNLILSKKLIVSASVLARVQSLRQSRALTFAGGYLASGALGWKMPKQFNFSLQLQFKNELPPLVEYFRGPLISGGTSIAQGYDENIRRQTQGATVTIQRANVFKARSLMLFVNWQRVVNDNSPFEILNPQYSVLYAAKGSVAQNLLANMSGDRFFPGLKCKLGFQISSMVQERTYLLNDALTDSRFSNAGLELKYLSRFSRLNIDLKVRADRFFSYLEQEGSPGVKADFGTISLFPKLRFAVKNNFSLVTEYGLRRLTENSWFSSLDANAFFNCREGFVISVIGHNLLDQQYIRSRSFNGPARSENSFAAVGRYVMLKMSLNF